MLSTITNTLVLLYLPLLLNMGCPTTDNYYKAVDIKIYQTANKDKTTTAFNLWSYKNITEHKFNVTITYKAGDLSLCKTILVKSKDRYSASKGYFIFSKIIHHKPEDEIKYFVYMECLDFECSAN